LAIAILDLVADHRVKPMSKINPQVKQKQSGTKYGWIA
jgi:hypothetical protein